MSKYKLPKIEELLSAGVHFGHQVKRWHPRMEPYIYTVKKNIHIIDLEQTEAMLKVACDFLYETAKHGGQIILVGTKKQARDILEIESKRSGALYVTERWIGGTLTNYKVIKKNIDKLLNFIRRKETGDLERYTKKERLLIDREIEKLQRYVGGIVALRGTPSAIVAIDTRRERTAINEASKYNVPVVALVDTNSDPSGVKYVIPGNDDAIKSVALILKAMADAIEEGYNDYEKAKTANAPVVAKPQTTEKSALEAAVDGSIKITGSEKPTVEAEIVAEVIDIPVIDADKSTKVKPVDAKEVSKVKKAKAKKEATK